MLSKQNVVIYPGYGVAKITKEIIKEINGEKVIFYELNFFKKDIKVLIPKNGLKEAGVRRISSREEILNIFNIFCFNYPQYWMEKINMVSWNRRSKEYQNKIRNGILNELAEIYRDLKFIERRKTLSFGEKAAMNQVEFLIAEECAIVMNDRPVEVVLKELKRCCEECLSGNKEKEKIESIFLQNIELSIRIEI